MTDRGAYVLSAAVLVAAAVLAVVPRVTAPPAVNPPTGAAPGAGAPVVQVIEYKTGEKGVIAVLPDGRFTVWSQFGSSSLTPNPDHGKVGGK